MQLTHLKHADIDFIRWDECVENSVGGLPYAMSWFLDIVSPGWEALVSRDYEYVMPVTVSSKFGIKYIVQPALTQQLGVFSRQHITEETVRLFLSKIPYLSYQINVNENNLIKGMQQLPNLVLMLSKPYSELQQAYSKNCIRNIAKAVKSGLKVEIVADADEVIAFLVANTTEKNDLILDKFRQLVKSGQIQQKTLNIGIRNMAGQLIAAVCFLINKQRMVYLLAVSNEEGKAGSAMFAIVDHIIQKYSGTEMILDFEGSRIQDIARFYKGFGATNRSYGVVKKFRPDFLTGKF